ncbi:protein phosphatase 1 regulatory subunit SDS22, putative [Pediculus humanus corporis]|uniref:Protein phosphatase 1 regulatory subunit SDS22, putative n=1 Tax=Pediculus humanus subsp. corporis TaxID=121224 RepID=E0VE28_PEDHC|nr:protein phosphatase 1 regulatory subunit SDS22, putative [Pediculus humanus corporis]EEB11634.1 protein phosphatase 1 regulatory subunit SDS22, putative [Pediculus humanus corporis]
MTRLLLEKVVPYEHKSLTLKKAGECLGILGKIWNLSEHSSAAAATTTTNPNVFPLNELCDKESECKLMDMEGYVDDYQYLHMEAKDMCLTDVTILPKYFVWLLSVDLSGNLLTNETSCPVTKLPNIVALKLNRNNFNDPYMPPMKHLQYLGLNNNRIKSLHRIYHPNLETLDLNYNHVRDVDPRDCWKLPKLTQLELRGNLLQTTEGIQYQSLVNLYLAQNKITELRGFEILINLERLHLRENPLSDLTGFTKSNVKLKYLNVRKCEIGNVEEFKKLSVLAGLKELVIKGNVFNAEPGEEAQSDENNENESENEEQDGGRRGAEEEQEVEEEEGKSKRKNKGNKTENDDDYGVGDGDKTNEESDMEEEEMENRLKILSYLPHLHRIDKRIVTETERQMMREMIEDEEEEEE